MKKSYKERMFKRIIRKQVFKAFEEYKKTCNSITKSWGINYIPLNNLIEITNKAMIITSEDEEMQEIVTAHNKMVETLIKTYKTAAKSFYTKKIPLFYINDYIEEVKKFYLKGLE